MGAGVADDPGRSAEAGGAADSDGAVEVSGRIEEGDPGGAGIDAVGDEGVDRHLCRGRRLASQTAGDSPGARRSIGAGLGPGRR